MGKYFTIAELSHSDTANARGIDNTPTQAAVSNLNFLIDNLLDPVRKEMGRPIRVSSGYRSSTLNAAVGGVSTSQHMKGQAADLDMGSRERNKQLFDRIVEMKKAGKIQFDQLIDERNFSWVHVSLKRSGNRGQILKC